MEVRDGISFFFSSRRRHTRYWRDWSSDVCSSDLPSILGRSVSLSIALASQEPTGLMRICPKRCLGSLEGMEPCHAWGRSLCWEGLYKCAENHPFPEGLVPL